MKNRFSDIFNRKFFILDENSKPLKSHMFSAFNGDAVYQRIEELDTLGHELRVTEFDVNEPNHVRKAEDIENFMRIAFSHKSITGINLWAWLKIGTSQDEWDKSMWEGKCIKNDARLCLVHFCRFFIILKPENHKK